MDCSPSNQGAIRTSLGKRQDGSLTREGETDATAAFGGAILTVNLEFAPTSASEIEFWSVRSHEGKLFMFFAVLRVWFHVNCVVVVRPERFRDVP
jgi:hypothetical protein